MVNSPYSPRRLLALASASAMVITLAACGIVDGGPDKASVSDDKMVINYARSEGLSTLDTRIAEVKGFYEKHGVTVNQIKSQVGPSDTAALGKQYDILQQTAQSTFEAINAGRKDIKIVGGLSVSTEDRPLFPSYVSKKVKGVSSWRDLEGKVGATASLTSFPKTAIDHLVAKDGGDPSTIKWKIVPFAALADQLDAGVVDFGWAVRTYQHVVEAGEHQYLGDPTNEVLGTPHAVSIMASTDKFLESHRDAVIAFNKARQEAMDWAEANEEEAKQIAIEWLDIPKEQVENQELSTFNASVTTDDLGRLYDFLKQSDAYGLTGMPPLESMIADDVANAAASAG